MVLAPLRYPGGKAQYIPIIEHYANLCPHKHYIEPFAGGAAVALHFAINRFTPVVINDKDPVIYAFWCSVLNDTDAFIERILNTPVTIKNWHLCKEILSDARNQSRFNLGFAMFFLNRCNFSGCINANPIGGLHQTGKWRLDARFNKVELIRRIRLIAKNKSRIKITCDNAITLVKKTNRYDFLYLDPPYYTQGKKLYNDYLNDDGHDRLAKALKKTSANWLMSYDKNQYVESLYQDKLVREEFVRYSFIKKIKAKELLITSCPPPIG